MGPELKKFVVDQEGVKKFGEITFKCFRGLPGNVIAADVNDSSPGKWVLGQNTGKFFQDVVTFAPGKQQVTADLSLIYLTIESPIMTVDGGGGE